MLRRIELHKYKCYKKHYIDFKDLSVIVGKNNAGKSTLIEALRLISIAVQKAKFARYKSPPNWTGLYMADKGFTPSLKGIDYSSDNVMYSYEDAPAKIIGVFANKVKVLIYLDDNGRIFVQIYNGNNLVKTQTKARELGAFGIKILPQIGPLQKEERLLVKAYVKANEFTNLTSLHFRNQIQYSYDKFQDYRELLRDTWPEISVNAFYKGDEMEKTNPVLLIRDGSFVTEAGKMGHGLQIWLQIMWFLSRCDYDDTIILDEPDVYLHADIQRRLIRFLKGRHQQTILATHSIEIISEVDPDNILIVDKSNTKSKYASSNPSVQGVVEEIGSIHNIELIRLWSVKRFILVEGFSDDIKFLKIFQDTLFPSSKLPIDNIPKVPTDGWGGWQRVIGGHKVISKGGQDIRTYCIFDSDYHIDEDIEARKEEARTHGINLHIWQKKEIENYLIVNSAIRRLVEKNGGVITLDDIDGKLDEFCEDLKDVVFDAISNEFQNRDKSKGVSVHNQMARTVLSKKWVSLANKLALVPGKKLISDVSRWCQTEFGFSISKFRLAKELQKNEIDNEIKYVLTCILDNKEFE